MASAPSCSGDIVAKKTEQTNFRVVVWPRDPGDFGWARIGGQRWSENEQRQICEKIAGLIKRHVSFGEDDRGDIRVVCDTEHSCEHCGSQWTEDDPTYNGGCCDKDEANNPAAAEAA